jgi:hypothetical protein
MKVSLFFLRTVWWSANAYDCYWSNVGPVLFVTLIC